MRKTVPYSEFMSKMAPYDYISFCQQVFVHLPDEKRKEVDAQAEIMRYLGPAKGQKAMKFLNKSNRVISSHDFKVATLISAPVPVATVPSESEISRDSHPCASNCNSTNVICPINSPKDTTCSLCWSALLVCFHHQWFPCSSRSRHLRGRDQQQEYTWMAMGHGIRVPVADWKRHLGIRTLPKGRRAIGAKWIYKTKTDKNGNIHDESPLCSQRI